MQDDMRAAAAQYYDANPTIPDDLAFYTARLPSADTVVLELGCGTGRVLLPLAAACGSISGLERSPAMLARPPEAAGRRDAPNQSPGGTR